MKVVGVDLSMTSSGIAVLSTGESGAAVHRVVSKGFADATLSQRSDRLVALRDQVVDLAAGAHLVVIEGPAFSVPGAMAGVYDRAGLWWLVVSRLLGAGLAVAVVPPANRAKYACGKGNAGKDAVLAAVVRRYPQVDISGNDVADAMVLASMGARYLGYPVEASLALDHLEAMSGGSWPAVSGRHPDALDPGPSLTSVRKAATRARRKNAVALAAAAT